MNEEDTLKRQVITHMVYTWIAFSLIFIVFGTIVIIMFSFMTYQTLDKNLEDTAKVFNTVNNINNNIRNQVPGYFADDDKFEEEIEAIDEQLEDIRDYSLASKITDVKYSVLIRDADYGIISTGNVNKNLENITDQISFDSTKLNEPYTIELNGSTYRAINIKIPSINAGEERYVQILVNADSEKALTNNFKNVVISSIVVGILLSIIASYILAKRTLLPAAETMKRQTEFVQNASHELRTPLTIIQAKQELLLREPNAKIIDKSEDIILTLNETKRLTKLTKDLMILASGYSSKMELSKENVNIDELIITTISPYKEIVDVEGKELKLDLKYEKNVNIDVSKIQQMLIILLDNAIKYTEKGDSIEIASFYKDSKCVIEVRDTGIGISDEGLKQVFNRFYREDRARNRETGGSGLGLSIADAIVKAHNGTIRASHNTPKGSIFTIRLPK